MERFVMTAFSSCLMLLGLLGGAFLYCTASAVAAEVSADIKGFCQKTYGHDAFPGVDWRDNGLLCSRRSDGGLGFIHSKITAAEVCAAQHATRRYRREGNRLLCLTGSATKNDKAVKPIDLKKHCKAAHGVDAFVTQRRTDNRQMCTVRTQGGLGLRHHLIDIADLCGGSTGRVEGTMLHCADRDARAHQPGDKEITETPASGKQGKAAGEGQDPSAPKRHLGEKADVAMRSVTGNLEGCAILGGGISFPERIGSDWESILRGHVPFPCPGLSGGWKGDLDAICHNIGSRQGWRGKIEWQGSRPICKSQGSGGMQSAIPTPLQFACAAGFAELTGKQLFPTRGEEGYIRTTGDVLAFRWDDRKLQCFFVPKETVNCYGVFLSEGSYPAGCKPGTVTVELTEIHFVEAEPPYEVIKTLPIGIKFRVKLVFESDPGRKSEPVSVINESSGQTLKLIARQTKDLKVFRTPPVNLLPEGTP